MTKRINKLQSEIDALKAKEYKRLDIELERLKKQMSPKEKKMDKLIREMSKVEPPKKRYALPKWT